MGEFDIEEAVRPPPDLCHRVISHRHFLTEDSRLTVNSSIPIPTALYSEPTHPSKTTFLRPLATMNADSRPSSHFRAPLELALQDYESQTGIVLANHPLAKQLGDCRSVKSVVDVLRERVPVAFGGDGSRIVKVLERVVSVLYELSDRVVLDEVRFKTWMGVTCF